MTKWGTEARGVAGRAQSAAPPVNGRGSDLFDVTGLLVRGAVVSTYVSDGEEAFPPGVEARRSLVYADCLVYSGRPGMRGTVLRHVSCGSGGLHDGRVWKPRAATQTISGRAIDGLTDDPMDLDCDHLLIGFIDGDVGQPTMLRVLEHPQRGIGNDDLNKPGWRDTLKLEDGQPDLWKHRGTFYGVDDSGNFNVDTRRAHGLGYVEGGGETAAESASFGNVTVITGDANTVTIIGKKIDDSGKTFELTVKNNEVRLKLQDGQSLLLVGKDASTVTTLGDGAMSVAIAEHLRDLYLSLKAALEIYGPHLHPSAMGPVGLPVPPLVVPPWAANVVSSKLKLPDG